MTRSIWTALFALALTPAFSFADALIRARSDVPATVYVDGQRVGVTPLDIAAVHRGQHEVLFRAHRTGLEQAYVVSVPRHGRIATTVAAQFALAAGCHPAPVVSIAPVIVSRPVVIARAPIVVRPYSGWRRSRHWR